MTGNELGVKFTRGQRSGIAALLLLMIFTQLVYFCFI